jgi:hypothetical protein
VVSDVDELTGHRVGFHGFPHGLHGGARGGNTHHDEDRVEQPPAASAAEAPAGARDDPHQQRKQRGRPHPPEHVMNCRAEHDEKDTGHAHEGCRGCGPSLRLIAEPHREHAQHGPAECESQQNSAGDACLRRLGERRHGEKQADDQSSEQGSGHDQAHVLLLAGIVTVVSPVRVNAMRGRHGEADPMHSSGAPVSSTLRRWPAEHGGVHRTRVVRNQWSKRD